MPEVSFFFKKKKKSVFFDEDERGRFEPTYINQQCEMMRGGLDVLMII